MEYVKNNDAYEHIIERLFEHYDADINESVDKFEKDNTYISEHMGDFLILERDYIKIYAVDPENFEGVYVLEYKFQPFGAWHEIVTFNR